MLLLLLLVPSALSLCPCDVSPECDTDCCCDLTCSDVNRAAFDCKNYTSSLPTLCCSTETLYSEATKSYSEVRRCTSGVFCLNEAPVQFGQFNTVNTANTANTANTGDQGLEQGSSAVLVPPAPHNMLYYKPSDFLLYNHLNITLSYFTQPTNYLGSTCLRSPLIFGRDSSSTCTRDVTLASDCVTGSYLDYSMYLTPYLLPYPSSTTYLDLNNKTSFLCEREGVQSACTEGTISQDSGTYCKNALRGLTVNVKLSEAMSIEDVSVTVVLARWTGASKWRQEFSVSYVSTLSEDTERRAGSVGYGQGAGVLSGVLLGDKVVMGSEPGSWLTLFQSKDCAVFERVRVRFGISQYYGCVLSRPFYNTQELSGHTKQDYCAVLGNTTKGALSVQQPTLLGKTGSSSVSDLTQWVTVVQATEEVPEVQGLHTHCPSIRTGSRLEVYYSEVGEQGNRQSVIVSAKLVHIVQDIQLVCDSTYCDPALSKPQHLLLSNSVQFIYQPATITKKYKVRPKTSILVPYDFFYPFTSASTRATSRTLLILPYYLLERLSWS